MSAAILAEILRLPAEERARLALEWIRSLDTEAEAGAADAWDAEIARRGAEVDARVAETMTVDEHRAHVRQREVARARWIVQTLALEYCSSRRASARSSIRARHTTMCRAPLPKTVKDPSDPAGPVAATGMRDPVR